MPFLKDFIINNSTKIILWKIIPGELDDKHISKEEIGLLKIRKAKNYFGILWVRMNLISLKVKLVSIPPWHVH